MPEWKEDMLHSFAPAAEKFIQQFTITIPCQPERSFSIRVNEEDGTFTYEGDIHPSEGACLWLNHTGFLAKPFETYRCDERTAQYFAALAAIYTAAAERRPIEDLRGEDDA